MKLTIERLRGILYELDTEGKINQELLRHADDILTVINKAYEEGCTDEGEEPNACGNRAAEESN